MDRISKCFPLNPPAYRFESQPQAQLSSRAFDLYITRMTSNHWVCSLRGWDNDYKAFFGTLILSQGNMDRWGGNARLSFQQIEGNKYLVTNLDNGDPPIEAWFYAPKMPEWHDGPRDYE